MTAWTHSGRPDALIDNLLQEYKTIGSATGRFQSKVPNVSQSPHERAKTFATQLREDNERNKERLSQELRKALQTLQDRVRAESQGAIRQDG